MKEKDRRLEILGRLDEEYGTEYVCYLHYSEPWQLLIAVILSAQCTDDRVNIVTKDLFVKYPSLQAFAEADLEEMKEDIRSIGFYNMKARNIILTCRALLKEHQGMVPDKLEDLLKLAGVGRKTANVIRGNIYHIPSIVVDTHVKRISRRLGFAEEEVPDKIEKELMKVLPKENWIRYNIQIIRFGREICKARRPKCEKCFLNDLCFIRAQNNETV